MNTTELAAALRKAYQLGQVYWQQADSDYTSQHRKADETRAKFEGLMAETLAAHEAAQPRQPIDLARSCLAHAVLSSAADDLTAGQLREAIRTLFGSEIDRLLASEFGASPQAASDKSEAS